MEDLFSNQPWFLVLLIALGLAPGVFFVITTFRNDGKIRFGMRSMFVGMLLCGVYCLAIREAPLERFGLTLLLMVVLVPAGNVIAVVLLRGMIEVWRLTGRLYAKSEPEPYLGPVNQEPADTGKYANERG